MTRALQRPAKRTQPIDALWLRSQRDPFAPLSGGFILSAVGSSVVSAAQAESVEPFTMSQKLKEVEMEQRWFKAKSVYPSTAGIDLEFQFQSVLWWKAGSGG